MVTYFTLPLPVVHHFDLIYVALKKKKKIKKKGTSNAMAGPCSPPYSTMSRMRLSVRPKCEALIMSPLLYNHVFLV